MRIGVISDTHGYYNPALPRVFAGVELILHAGDIGATQVIRRLEQIAPVEAVRGNIDTGFVADRYPLVRILDVAGRTIHLAHRRPVLVDLGSGSAEAERAVHRPDIVVFGHSHRVERLWNDGVLYLNPGIAAYPRRTETATVLVLSVPEDHEGVPEAEIVRLG